MRHIPGSAPIWLFSFVDLAFLLLIAFTQIARDSDLVEIELGEIDVPRLQSPVTGPLSEHLDTHWQIRVHPPGEENAQRPPLPFEVFSAAVDVLPAREAGARMAAGGLRAELAALRAARVGKPVLAPHRDSRSEDLLVAVGLLEEYWPGTRGAAVAPPSPVSAPPPKQSESPRP